MRSLESLEYAFSFGSIVRTISTLSAEAKSTDLTLWTGSLSRELSVPITEKGSTSLHRDWSKSVGRQLENIKLMLANLVTKSALRILNL